MVAAVPCQTGSPPDRVWDVRGTVPAPALFRIVYRTVTVQVWRVGIAWGSSHGMGLVEIMPLPIVRLRLYKGCVLFSPISEHAFFFMNVPSSPHTSSHMFGYHPATVRLAGRKRHAKI